MHQHIKRTNWSHWKRYGYAKRACRMAQFSLWNVRAFRHLFRIGRRLARQTDTLLCRTNHEPCKDSDCWLWGSCTSIQSDGMECRHDCETGERCRHEIHRVHDETSRRILHVQNANHWLQHSWLYAIWQRCFGRVGRSLQKVWHETRLVLLSPDWHFPKGIARMEPDTTTDCTEFVNQVYSPLEIITPELEDYIVSQLTELMTNYGEIETLWFDMGLPTAEQSQRFRETVKNFNLNALSADASWTITAITSPCPTMAMWSVTLMSLGQSGIALRFMGLQIVDNASRH